jgi:hypothetical protein
MRNSKFALIFGLWRVLQSPWKLTLALAKQLKKSYERQ